MAICGDADMLPADLVTMGFLFFLRMVDVLILVCFGLPFLWSLLLLKFEA